MSDQSIKVAAAQYRVERLASWDEYEQKLTRLVREAADAGAQLLVFPEYGSLELISLNPARSVSSQLQSLQTLLDRYLALHTSLAAAHGVHILAASFPVRLETGRYRNRAYFISPDGAVAHQDKHMLTRFEREDWNVGIESADALNVFDTALGRIGVAICYDAEFPLIVRAQVDAGAQIVLVPSCTDTDAGYHRVKIGAQARALENQCFIVHACTVGEASWCEAIDNNVGAAGVYTPPNGDFPSDGVLATGKLNQAGWVYADLDLSRVRRVREDGETLNHRDWPGQLPPIQIVNKR